jgi:hypothetical protein
MQAFQHSDFRRAALPLAVAVLATIGLVVMICIHRSSKQRALAEPQAASKPFSRSPAFRGTRAPVTSLPEYSPRVALPEPKSILPPVEEQSPAVTATNGVLL